MRLRLSFRLVGLLLAGISAVLPSGLHAAGTTPKTISFTIGDELGPGQTQEEIAVSINHLPVGTLKVEAHKTSDTLKVTVPFADTYHYDLCGTLKLRDPKGKASDRKIDNGGDFTDLDAHSLNAYNSEDTIFYLMDRTIGFGTGMPGDVTAGHSCSNTVAMR